MEFSVALTIAKDPKSSSEQLDELYRQAYEEDGNLEFLYRLLAKNPKASPSLLEELSHDNDWATRKYVVLNPNASKETLVELAPKFQGDFFKNPAFDWLILEDPDLLFKIGAGGDLGAGSEELDSDDFIVTSTGFFKDILKKADCPESFMRWAAKNGSEQELLSLVMNPKISVDVLKQLADRCDWAGIVAKAIVLKEPQLLADIRECEGGKLIRGWNDGDSDEFIDVNIGQDILDKILKSPNCPVDFMTWASVHGQQREKLALAVNIATPEYILREMLKSDKVVHDAVALHVKICSPLKSFHPMRLFENAIKTAVSELDCHNAREAWKRGWIDAGQWVWLGSEARLHVLGLTEYDFTQEDWQKKYTETVLLVANIRRRKTPIGRSSELDKLNSLDIFEIEKILKLKNPLERAEIAWKPGASENLLSVLSKYKNVDVLIAVAGNSSTPIGILEKLVKNRLPAVRKSLAQNSSTPKELLDILLNDEDYDVRKITAAVIDNIELFVQAHAASVISKIIAISEKYKSINNSELSQALREIQKNGKSVDFITNEFDIINNNPHESMIAKIIDGTHCNVYLRSENPIWAASQSANGSAVRLLALCHPSASAGALFANYKSSDWLDRLAITCNPSCPSNLLALMANDTNLVVAQMARESGLYKNNKGKGKVKKEFVVLTFPCPNCKGNVKEDSGNYTCCGVEGAASGCGFSFNKIQAGRAFMPAEVEVLLREHKSGLLRGFISKAGKPFNAEMVLRFDEAKKTCRVVFDFVKDKKVEPVVLATALSADAAPQSSLGACPKCGAAVHAHGTNYVCTNSLVSPTQAVPSCDFKTGQVILQQAISAEQLGKLLTSGRTDLLDGFISARTQKAFKAMLVWDGNAGKVGFEFGSSRN